MEKIYAPWRDKYVTKTVKETSSEERTTNKDECIFCKQLAENNDDKFFIIKRFKHAFVMMNLYPYNGGHLMVLPIEHKATLDECSSEERAELMELVNKSIQVLQKTLKPKGFNVGMNLGKAGGGGIPSHLHIHILPRWEGDTNFMPLLCETKPIAVDLKRIFEDLKKHF